MNYERFLEMMRYAGATQRTLTIDGSGEQLCSPSANRIAIGFFTTEPAQLCISLYNPAVVNAGIIASNLMPAGMMHLRDWGNLVQNALYGISNNGDSLTVTVFEIMVSDWGD
jgi:hypothetical protein